MATAQLGTLLRHIQHLAVDRGAQQRTDRQLLDDFVARRDEAAFAALIARHGPMVLRVCRRALDHEQDSEDAFQATFLVLARHGGSIRQREALTDWLHGVAYRTAMKAKRTAARRRNHEAQRRARTPEAVAGPTWSDVQAVLDEEIQRLPGPFRAAFVLCMLEGKSGPEAAAALGCKEGTVKSRLTRARQQLRRQLARRGIELSALLSALALAQGAGKAAVPAALARATLRFGLLVAAGSPAAGSIPPHLAALAEGVTGAMSLTKAKIATALLALGLLAGAGALTHRALAAKQAPAPPAAEKSAAPAAKEGGKPQPGDDKGAVTCGGRVLDPDGKPVAQAQVYFTRSGLPQPPREGGVVPPEVRTDTEGRFHFPVARTDGRRAEGPSGFRATLTAVAPGHGPAWAVVTKPEGLKDVTLRLVKDDVPIQGRVRDLEGKPIRGVTVRVLRLRAAEGEDLTTWLDLLRSRKAGHGLYRLTQLEPEAMGLARPVVTGADGRFHLTGVGRERVALLRFEGPTVETRDAYVRTRPGPAVRLAEERDPILPPSNDFVCHGATFEHAAAPTRPVTGVARDKDTGRPLAGVTVRAPIVGINPENVRRDLRTTTDPEGHYRLVGLPAKEGPRIHAVPAAGQPYLGSALAVGAGTALEPVTLDFALKRGVVIRGRVTNKETGQPMRAQVEYFAFLDNPHLREAPGFRGNDHVSAGTGADGSFTLVGLPGRGLLAAKAGEEGRYVMASGADRIKGAERGHHFRTDPFICAAPLFNTLVEINPARGAETFTCDVALDPGKTVTGTLLDPDGKPLEGVSVDGSWGLSLHLRNLPTARFEVPAIDPNHPRPLFFRHRGRKLGAAVLFRGDEPMPVTVRLQRCATLSGRIVDEDGQPRSGVHVTGNIHGGQLNLQEGWYGFLGGTTDKDGRFRIEGVIPGVKVGLSTQKGASITGRVVEEVLPRAGEVLDLGDLKVKEQP
jgi:RNA polymerase sigma factor (sigma-70 family)